MQKTKPEQTQRADIGFALRGRNGGYFDINGIGDWSLAGDVTLCEVFPTRKEAEEAITDNDLEDEDMEIVQIVRSIACVVTRGESGR